MLITFTLQSIYSGATYVAGPFNISGVTNTGTVTELASNVSKAALLTGVTISDISDATTGGTITSTGTCSSSIDWLVNGTTNGGDTPDTYSFDLWCTQDLLASPVEEATHQVVVASASELGIIPTTNTYIRIGGSPNVDYVYRYNGQTGEVETPGTTVVEVMGPGDFNCDIGPQ